MKLKNIFLPAVMALSLVGCSDEKLGPTIFPDVTDDIDPSSYSYQFDTWVNRNFRDVYNLEFKYRMEDVEADMNYNLVPATYANARDLCLLTYYLWFETYREHCGEDFLKTYGPRILHLIGSPAYNPNTGTEILGLAEGGLKVTLYKVNEMELDNIHQLNEYYFRTMHHEFGHILHQTKSYPTEFNLLSTGRYDSGTWQNKAIGYVASQGFITPYASSENREDFAETIANYLTRTDDQLELILWMADKGWTTGADDDKLNKDDAEYFAYYYLPDPTKPEDRVYFLTANEHDATNRVCLVANEKGKDASKAKHLYTVEEVEAYLEQKKAEVGGEIYQVEDKDTIDGRAMILQKQNIARNWFKDTWSLDFDKLREIVQRRQSDFDIEALRAQVDAIK